MPSFEHKAARGCAALIFVLVLLVVLAFVVALWMFTQ